MSQTPAGWYPQPDGQQRYWDGEKWTEHVAPGAPMSPPPSAPGDGKGTKDKRNWFIRHKIMTGLAAVVAIAIIWSAIGAGGDDTTTSASASEQTSQSEQKADGSGDKKASDVEPAADEKEKLAGIGDKVRDGKFEFVVKNVLCGKDKVGDSFMSEKAQGQFCFVKVSVKNIGDEAQMFMGDAQSAYDAKGNKFENDTEAEIMLEDNDTFLEDINPGNKVTGTVIFDVPKRTKITTLELHDSVFSGGVKVDVTK
ncbi:MAG TPA: DUF4352 domain-containing protein [Segeticoccus sp.]|nr:DUF4352 domain-containing protein [Segeticoccus sp.]